MEKQSSKLFSPWPCFADDEIEAVTRVLRSGKVNQWTGSEVTSFEKEYADYVGAKYAVALANGSVALDIALVMLGIVPGDEVIVTPRSFVASAGCVALRGAVPVFVDVDHDSQNITPDTVKNAICSKTKAVIAVHLAGWPCELDELRALCDEHGIYLIEDCAQAHGAGIGKLKAQSSKLKDIKMEAPQYHLPELPQYHLLELWGGRGRQSSPEEWPSDSTGQAKLEGLAEYKADSIRHAGSFGHIAAFSFCQDKIMTTGGEGGMLVTDDEDLWKKAWSFKDHGKDYDSVFNKEHMPCLRATHRQAGFQWLVKSFGTNYRMTEMQAAIGRVMLKKLDKWVEQRRRLASILTDGFREIPALKVTIPPDYVYHSYYKYYVFVRPERLKKGWNRDRILGELEKRGVPCGTGVCPEIYLEEAFRSSKLEAQGSKLKIKNQKRLPVAKELGETSLMFLVHPTLTEENMHWVVGQVEEVMSLAKE